MSSTGPTPEHAHRPEDTYVNRELSWLHFNERVLALAEGNETPLLERAKFLAIFASNLDEFYMVRVAGLKRQLAAGVLTRSPDGLTARQQLDLISEHARPLVERHARLFCDEILPALTRKGVHVARWSQLDARQRDELHLLFQEQIFPVVTPLAVDPGHPFPYISNLSLNLAVQVADPLSGRIHFARIKVPPVLSRFTALSQDGLFVPIEDAQKTSSKPWRKSYKRGGSLRRCGWRSSPTCPHTYSGCSSANSRFRSKTSILCQVRSI